MTTLRRGPGWLFHVTAGATTAFIISVLAMVATLFGDPEAPINGWINQYGTMVLLVEIVAIGVFGFAAMANDARQTRKERLLAKAQADASIDQPLTPPTA